MPRRGRRRLLEDLGSSIMLSVLLYILPSAPQGQGVALLEESVSFLVLMVPLLRGGRSESVRRALEAKLLCADGAAARRETVRVWLVRVFRF